METTIMENQMEKNMESEMETGIILGVVYWGGATRLRNIAVLRTIPSTLNP